MSSRHRLHRVLVIVVGSAATIAMISLGLWQMQVFRDQGQADARARTELPAVPLAEQLARPAGDTYGRRVTVTGSYDNTEVVRVATGNEQVRVLQAFRLPDGSVLPVLRGSLTSGQSLPSAPDGSLTVTGLLLASEKAAPTAAGADMGSVRLPTLAQRWPHNLVAGYIVLTDTQPGTAGLAPAHVELPTQEGNLRNGGYALQWWVFAGFAVALTVAISRSLKEKDTP